MALVAAVGVLVLALWVSGAEEVWFVDDPGQAGETAEADRPDRESNDAQSRPVSAAELDPDEIGIWFDILASVLLVAMAVALLFLLVRKTGARRARRRIEQHQKGVTRALGSTLADPIEVPRALVEKADELQALMLEGSPRNAIVSCWVALEEACSQAGVARHPAETSVEFTTRVLGSFSLDEGSVTQLAGLYREARFSAHALDEQHRAAALGCLREVQAQLRTQSRRNEDARS